MKSVWLCAIAAVFFAGCGKPFLENVANAIESRRAPSETQMIKALKTALNDGAANAASELAKEGGFSKSPIYKIFLPPEADAIVNNAKLIPGGEKLIDDAIARINAAAESAAKDAAPIFAKAIADMTIADAIGILKGGDDAATNYLRAQTSGELKAAFAPKINAALAKPIIAGVSAQKSWDTLTNGYNRAASSIAGKLAKLEPIKTSINDFVLDKALFALFSETASAEAKLRADPLGAIDATVRSVFEYAKNSLNKR
ncbi:MAG: DUF4197 domain-containing protein [Helicobacteraceae bacterium]|jgi:hypothetical protein|nr:DUF4197 domain-containing protein [Helicobacteraceae bacterium]